MSNQLTGSRGPMVVRQISGGFGSQGVGTLVFPATVNVADPAGLTDNEVAQLSVDAAGRLRVLASAAAGAVFPVVPSVLTDSVGTAGTVAAPGAGVAIATLAAPAAGTYEIVVWVETTAEPIINNMELRRGGAAFITPLLVPPSGAIVLHGPYTYRMALSGAQNVTVNAIAAATGGSAYFAQIEATRIA